MVLLVQLAVRPPSSVGAEQIHVQKRKPGMKAGLLALSFAEGNRRSFASPCWRTDEAQDDKQNKMPSLRWAFCLVKLRLPKSRSLRCALPCRSASVGMTVVIRRRPFLRLRLPGA
jgi:hypothetical protein